MTSVITLFINVISLITLQIICISSHNRLRYLCHIVVGVFLNKPAPSFGRNDPNPYSTKGKDDWSTGENLWAFCCCRV